MTGEIFVPIMVRPFVNFVDFCGKIWPGPVAGAEPVPGMES